jgi:hypothetical protein
LNIATPEVDGASTLVLRKKSHVTHNTGIPIAAIRALCRTISAVADA